MKTLKIVLCSIAVLIVMGGIIKWSNANETKNMAINYCWDSNGEHYVAPNEACRH